MENKTRKEAVKEWNNEEKSKGGKYIIVNRKIYCIFKVSASIFLFFLSLWIIGFFIDYIVK